MVKAVYSVLIFVQLFQKKCFLPAQQSVLLGAPVLFSKFKKVLDHLFLAAGIRKITAYLTDALLYLLFTIRRLLSLTLFYTFAF